MLSGLFLPLMLLIAHVLASLKPDETPAISVHKVYRVVPKDAAELEAITALYRQSTNLELDFWKSPTAIGASADVMVPPDAIEFVLDYFKSNNLDYWTTIENVEQLILQREKTKRPSWAQFNSSDPILASFFRKRMSDDYFTANKAKYGFGINKFNIIVIIYFFEFSRSDPTPQTRFWQAKNDQTLGLETGSSSDICSDIYAGSEAFSEPEARAIRDKMLSSELRGKIDAFITLHTYSQINVGKNGVEAIEKVYGTKFKFGTGADILYPSAGGSDDWAKAKAGVKYVYLLELRPGEEEWDGFLLSQHQLIPTARETWEGVKVVLNAVLNRSRQPQQSRIVSTFAATTMSTSLSTSMVTTARPVTVGHRIDQQSLRTNFHDRLQRLRQSQMEARVRQQQFRAQPGQSVLQFGGIFPAQQSTTQRTLLPSNVQSFNQQTQSCTDRSRWCAAWLRSNPRLCVESSIFMRTDCRRSCFFCS
ncbi:Carboxypeptidase A2 [Aphelenchoides besseyi]|nr:Carboxypeptidase A2 [Aphelenchoides besseyi]